jgi:CheY-like chemotaxis protein
LFQPFVQIDNPRQSQVKGTGLGLSVTRALAALLGGHVSFTSALDQGSIFRAHIPREYVAGPDGEPASAAPHAAVAARERRGILIIDDDEVASYLLRLALGNGGRIVTEARSGEEGLAVARKQPPPQVIFLDLHMPSMDGYRVLTELKADPATRAIPVVVHTSQSIDPAAAARLSVDAIAVLSKSQLSQPEGRRELEAALHKAGL